MQCPDCKRDFPARLLSPMASGPPLRYDLKCPLCALRIVNEQHKLPPGTPFRGPAAKQMYADAMTHLREVEAKRTGTP